MTPTIQINAKFNPIAKIPEGFSEGISYQILAIDRIEEGNDLVTEFMLVDADGKFQWVKADLMVQAQIQEPKPAFTKHNGGYGRQPRRAY
jgi:hypothetical protein